MTLAFPQDTPIHRASILELTPAQLEELVTSMQERRMRSYTAYTLAMEAKKKIKDEKDKIRYQRVLDLAAKRFESVDKTLTQLSKYVAELKVLELTLGD